MDSGFQMSQWNYGTVTLFPVCLSAAIPYSCWRWGENKLLLTQSSTDLEQEATNDVTVRKNEHQHCSAQLSYKCGCVIAWHTLDSASSQALWKWESHQSWRPARCWDTWIASITFPLRVDSEEIVGGHFLELENNVRLGQSGWEQASGGEMSAGQKKSAPCLKLWASFTVNQGQKMSSGFMKGSSMCTGRSVLCFPGTTYINSKKESENMKCLRKQFPSSS